MSKRRSIKRERREAHGVAEAGRRRLDHRRRLIRVVGAAGPAAVLVAVAIVVSSGGAGKNPEPLAPQRTAVPFPAVPEREGVLGRVTGTISVTEFMDLQCPACGLVSSDVVGGLVDDYVRSGRVHLRAHILHFIGPDSTRAARVAAGAQAQGRLWRFVETFYAAQGEENSGYMTNSFLRDVARGAGVDASRAFAFARTPAAAARLRAADAAARRLGVTSTPTFVVARPGGAPVVTDSAGVRTAIDTALAR